MHRNELFFPWQKMRTVPSARQKLFLPVTRKGAEAEFYFDCASSPYFSLPNPKGTIASFLKALREGKQEEAAAYLSDALRPLPDLTEFGTFLEGMKSYRFYGAAQSENHCKVVLLTQAKSGATDVFAFSMIAEPTRYGKWKICRIVKE